MDCPECEKEMDMEITEQNGIFKGWITFWCADCKKTIIEDLKGGWL